MFVIQNWSMGTGCRSVRIMRCRDLLVVAQPQRTVELVGACIAGSIS
jgi:hypothetical protein